MDFETLLGQLEASRPDLSDSLALLRQYNQQKKQESEQSTSDTEEQQEVEKLMAIVERQRAINAKLLQRFQRLEKNYGHLIDHMDQMAEAIGACPECWGENLDCSHCNGRGKPGHYQPNGRYFDHYVRPVLRKLKKPEIIS